MKHLVHGLAHSRFLEHNIVCYFLSLTQIWHPEKHMQKVINSNQARKSHRKRVGEENILSHHGITYWHLLFQLHKSNIFARLQKPQDCVEGDNE